MELASFQPYFENKAVEDNALVLQQISNERGVFGGVVGLSTVGAIQQKVILPHEKVLHSRFSSIAEAFLKSGIINKPVLLGYPEHPGVAALAQDWAAAHACSFTYVENGSSHSYWVIDDPNTVAQLINFFRDIPLCYIADGHHRMGAIRYLYESNLVPNAQMLSALFSFKNLRINPYHRLVALRQSIAEVLNKLHVYLEPLSHEPPLNELSPHTLAVQHRNDVMYFKWKSSAISSYRTEALDVQLFDEIVLRNIFKIEDASASDQVTYFPDDQCAAMKRELLSRENSMGFYLPSVQLQQFMDSCEQGIMMPPKSTYFEPRILSGHIHHKLSSNA